MIKDTASDTADWYSNYYLNKGIGRNDPSNPEVLFQDIASYRALTLAFSNIDRNSKILDVGGGDGAGLAKLIQLGFDPKNLSNVDLMQERIGKSKIKLPQGCNSFLGDASNLESISSEEFDIVFTMGMFIQLTDEDLSQKIASEMIRVCKSGGKILVFDWAYDFWQHGYSGVSKVRISKIFKVGSSTKYIKNIKGQMTPPIGRTFSKYLPSLYFMAQKIPFFTGYFANILVKN
jgi:ubiquinone/menaquinone biosynthesis C-methylase UbiE